MPDCFLFVIAHDNMNYFDLLLPKEHRDNGIDYRTMQQLRSNKNITAHTIEKLCRILDCTPNDILTFTNDDMK